LRGHLLHINQDQDVGSISEARRTGNVGADGRMLIIRLAATDSESRPIQGERVRESKTQVLVSQANHELVKGSSKGEHATVRPCRQLGSSRIIRSPLGVHALLNRSGIRA
jgi:hypothetical protein